MMTTPCSHFTTHYYESKGNLSSGFSSNSKADAYELLENLYTSMLSAAKMLRFIYDNNTLYCIYTEHSAM